MIRGVSCWKGLSLQHGLVQKHPKIGYTAQLFLCLKIRYLKIQWCVNFMIIIQSGAPKIAKLVCNYNN